MTLPRKRRLPDMPEAYDAARMRDFVRAVEIELDRRLLNDSGIAGIDGVTTFSQGLLALSSAATWRSGLGLGSAALSGAGDFDPAGTAATSMSSHLAAPNPHPQYTTVGALGTMAYQHGNAVAITGGTISDLTSLTVDGNTTLGDAAGDTLTLNAGAWTLPNTTTVTMSSTLAFSGNVRVGSTVAPTVTLDVTGSMAVSGDVDIFGTTLARGNVTLGDSTTDTVNAVGHVGIGSGALSNIGLYVAPGTSLSGATQWGQAIVATGSSAATTAIIGLEIQTQTQGIVFTAASADALRITNAALGAGSTITTQRGISISDLTVGTNNRGIESAITAGANKFFLYSSGNADSVHSGGVRIGSTAAPTVALDVTGAGLISSTLGVTGVTTLSDFLVLPKTSGKGIKVDTASPTFGWRDLEGIIKEPPVGAGSPVLTTFRGNIKGMAFTTSDTYDLVYHMPHDWVPSSDIHIHPHWAHNDTSISGNLVFTYYVTYAKGHNQAVYPADITITQTIATTDIATTPQYSHRLNELQLSAASPSASQLDTDDLEPDGIIKVHFEMTTLPTLSGGSGKIFVDHIDIHYQSSNIGTKAKAPDFWT